MRDYNSLTITDIIEIFSEHLKCPDNGCEECKLCDEKVGCFRLRDMAMKKTINIFNKLNEVEADGKNN